LGWAALAWVLWEGSAALALALSGGLWVASAVLALARLAVGLVLAGGVAPAWSVALLLAPLWAGIRAGGFGAPLGAGIRAGGFGAPLGAGIRAGGSDARPGGAHRSSGSDLGPSPMGPVTDGTRIMGTTLTCATLRTTPATTATTNHRWPRPRGSRLPGPGGSAPRAPSGPSLCGGLDWKLAAISATKFSNAVNLPLSAGGMPMKADDLSREGNLARHGGALAPFGPQPCIPRTNFPLQRGQPKEPTTAPALIEWRPPHSLPSRAKAANFSWSKPPGS
jgi:hypothetical protein